MRQLLACCFSLMLLALPARALELAAGSGEALPPLRFLDLEGNETGLDAYRGKVVVLNLWATWCAPCREEMPSLDRLSTMLDPDKAVVVALSVDRAGPDRVRVRDWLHSLGGARPPYKGVTGDISFRREAPRTLLLVRLREGVPTTVPEAGVW